MSDPFGEEDIIRMFNTSANQPYYTDETAPPMVYIKALHEVATALKNAGTDISLDVRAGRAGAQKDLMHEKVAVYANGTLTMDGQPLEFVVQGYDDKCFFLLYAGTGKVMQYHLERQGYGPDAKWNAPTTYGKQPSFTETLAVALGGVKTQRAELDAFDIAPAPAPAAETGDRIEVSSPLKLKRPGQ